jgi:hypothetical protein
MADATSAPTEPQAPRPQALMVLRSLTGIVDQATTVATYVARHPEMIAELPHQLRVDMRRLCDAVFDMDYRTTDIHGRSPDSLPGI